MVTDYRPVMEELRTGKASFDSDVERLKMTVTGWKMSPPSEASADEARALLEALITNKYPPYTPTVR